MQTSERDVGGGNQHKSKKGIVTLVIVSFNTTEFLEAIEKAFYQNAQPAPKWSCLWGLGGSALNKQPGIFAPAKIPGLASVGPTRHCLPVSRTPYLCPFGRYFFK